MKKSSSKVFPIVLSVFCLLYSMGFVIPLFTGEYTIQSFSFSNVEHLTVTLMFLLFLSATIISWFNGKVSGILILIWHFLIWVFGLFVWPEAGMVLVLAFPILLLAVAMLEENFFKDKEIAEWREKQKQTWNYSLNLLLVNYGILYLVVIISSLTLQNYDYLNLPFILFPILFLVFIFGFYFSYKNKLVAGILFLIWFVIVSYGTFTYFEFGNEGPHMLFGSTILIHGIFYLIYHYKFIKQ